jgi:hypothetical protein
MLGAPFLLHETLGCPIANLHSARSDLWESQFVLHPTQLRKKHCFVKSTSNDLTAVGITTCLPSELTSSLRIESGRAKAVDEAALTSPLYEEIGRLKIELDWLKKKLTNPIELTSSSCIQLNYAKNTASLSLPQMT